MNQTVILQQDDDGDIIIPLTDEMLDLLGVKEGDMVEVKINEDKTLSILPIEK